ncbi:type I-U CRISPR-associated protein Cas5/Cas6 [Actinomyces sp. 432]|uniref:type I-G CRISPR-associated protein Csb2 n=1 Tax=Actinomyces sp. 432 TaxID=2057798 RepID=UPI0013741E1A|nr:type I-U CRISPR-associated protein Csb2 [Actinomyces sp. 432]QHO91422.1 type I-U CRISPR-associated protein Cas5/Cas6 [Actinomyces sp. 432]
MTLRLDITLLSERYDAGGGEDPRAAEWPPHPARAFAALRAVAGEDELGPLEELERLAPPLIHASPTAAVGARHSRGYVVKNVRDNKGGHQTHPGRTSVLRQRTSTLPEDARVQFDWPDGDALSDGTVADLDRLARRVPYLGRSTSSATLAFSRVGEPTPLPGLTTYEPTVGRSPLSIRVPYPGYLDELNALYREDQPAWQAAGPRARRFYREVGAAETSDESSEEISAVDDFDSPYPDLVILRFEELRPSGHLVSIFTEALRRKVMGQTENPLPPALHGHGTPGLPHVAYLGLPFVGNEHADGQLMALAVSIPGLEHDERLRILRGILGEDPERDVVLRVNGFRQSFRLRYAPDETRPFTSTVERWTLPARTWATATPLVLDRYPKDRDLAAAVAESFVNAGLPEPREVEVSKEPMVYGAVRLRPQELPKRCQGRLYTHARVTFDRPVRGPILAGAGRYFGVGLFAPEYEEEQQ